MFMYLDIDTYIYIYIYIYIDMYKHKYLNTSAPNSYDGSAKIDSKKSSQNHVARQVKARQEKKDTQDRYI
jgi:hypothetical protein